VGLDRDALRRPVDGRPQVERGVCGEQDGFEQPVDVDPALGRDVDEHGLAAVLLGDKAVLGELLTHLVGVGALLVDLVHRDHDRHLGRLGVVERLDRLRHDAVVGRHHQDHDVGGLGTTGTHGGERLVTRGVDERDRRSSPSCSMLTWYAPMCWVMPPASPSTTLLDRIASSSLVLPWST
jgi:hypothetical protein